MSKQNKLWLLCFGFWAGGALTPKIEGWWGSFVVAFTVFMVLMMNYRKIIEWLNRE